MDEGIFGVFLGVALCVMLLGLGRGLYESGYKEGEKQCVEARKK